MLYSRRRHRQAHRATALRASMLPHLPTILGNHSGTSCPRSSCPRYRRIRTKRNSSSEPSSAAPLSIVVKLPWNFGTGNNYYYDDDLQACKLLLNYRARLLQKVLSFGAPPRVAQLVELSLNIYRSRYRCLTVQELFGNHVYPSCPPSTKHSCLLQNKDGPFRSLFFRSTFSMSLCTINLHLPCVSRQDALPP